MQKDYNNLKTIKSKHKGENTIIAKDVEISLLSRDTHRNNNILIYAEDENDVIEHFIVPNLKSCYKEISYIVLDYDDRIYGQSKISLEENGYEIVKLIYKDYKFDMSGVDFSYPDMYQRKIALFLELDKTQEDSLFLASEMIEDALHCCYAFLHKTGICPTNHIRIFLNHFEDIPVIDKIERLIAIIRSYNISLVVICKNRDSLQNTFIKKYKTNGDMVICNCSTLIDMNCSEEECFVHIIGIEPMVVLKKGL